MARHNRHGEGTDQHGAHYTISYQPDWLKQIKVSRTLAGSSRQSTKTLFRNPAPCAERPPGDRIRIGVTSEDEKLDLEIVIVDDSNRVDQLVVTSRSGDGKGDITFIIDGSLPGPGGLGKTRRRRRKR